MKLILKEGRFINVGGIEQLHFEPSNVDIEMMFSDSVDKVTHILNAYELKKWNNSDVYILYPLLKGSVPIDEIEEEIKKISLKDDSNILNAEDTTICMPVTSDNYNTIFWDVMNHVIIVFKKENLKKLLLELEKSRIPKWINFKTNEDKNEFLEQSYSLVYKKASTF